MKKIIFVLLIGAMLFSWVACGSEDGNQTDAEIFTKVMEDEGFTVEDTTESHNLSLVEQSLAASNDVLTIHFLGASDKADADLIFYQIIAYKRLQRDLHGAEAAIKENIISMLSQLDRYADIDEELIANTQNLSSYSDSAHIYYEVMRLGNTVLYVETELENIGEVMRIMNANGDALV